MEESEFWVIVKQIDWDTNKDYKAIKKHLLGTLSAPKVVGLRIMYGRLYTQLRDVVDAYIKSTGISAGTGDDGTG